MSIDQRSRRYRDIRDLGRDEVFDGILPAAVERNGRCAARGIAYKDLGSLAVECAGRSITLGVRNGDLLLSEGAESADTVARLEASALSDLVQDVKTTMGLAMAAKVEVTRGGLENWIAWEPVFRALLDGRPVHEKGAIMLHGRNGSPLDLRRRFSLADDRDEVAHFLREAGFLHVTSVFTDAEMKAVESDLNAALAKARPDDGASWWAGDAHGRDHAVRILWFEEQSPTLRKLLNDDRLRWLATLTGDRMQSSKMSAEGLIKPLDIVSGLSDLPWHKDCGQGGHSYTCSGLTVGISVTGADRRSGALGVVPGSHRANVQTAGRDPSLDLEPLMLETRAGDLTVHCSDTLHMSHRPRERPRKVVYTAFRLAPRTGDKFPTHARSRSRAERAELTDVRDRIAAADRS